MPTDSVRTAPRRATRPLGPTPRRASRAAAADDRFFRLLVGSMRNGVIAIHRDGTLALMNDEAYRIFALPRTHGDIGRSFTDIFKDRPDLLRVLSSAFDLHTLPNRAELRLRDLDRVIGYTLSQVRDEAERSVGAVLFFKDLTQVEQLEERERLRDRLASLGEIAAGIAHELKNPLAGIEVMAGLLRRQVPDQPDAQAMLADLISEAKLANAIVVEMLEFVRPVRLQLDPIDLAEVVQQALALADGKRPRRGTRVRVDLQPGLPSIDGDHHQLCQAFANLMINAFEALDGQGQLDVRVRAAAIEQDPAFAGAPRTPMPVVIIEIADDGPGVAPDLCDRIFLPFFTTKTKGSGLGLPIVRKIIDAHDGRIDLNSAPGRGTEFRMTLPVSADGCWFK